MRIATSPPLHLTYCSNIHPGESWSETLHNIRAEATKVKAQVCPNAAFGLGLRLSAAAAEELSSTDGALLELRDELRERGMYAFTLNGFPYGAFHGTAVKEAVYRPDWRETERLSYTLQLIEILRRLLPEGVSGSISTVPIGFARDIAAPADVKPCVANLLECAVALWRARENAGVDIALAIEPEPACYIETTAEALAFFERELLSRPGLSAFARATGLEAGSAEEAIRRHLGLCFDTCHAAVQFEDARESVRAIRAAGVRLAKVQATTGLHVEPVDTERAALLRAFADGVYLHQVVSRSQAGAAHRLDSFVDLDGALAALAAGTTAGDCWRVHFHVPVFERTLAPFANTQDFLREALEEIVRMQLCDQIEVETYTWSVLPERYRSRALSEMIAGELRWTAAALLAAERHT